MNRRQFFADIQSRIVYWAPWLGMFGFRIREQVYRASTGPFRVQWVDFFGKTVGWLDDVGRIMWIK